MYGITQTADGYLWIAAEKGLVRFDGVSFRLFEPSGSTRRPAPRCWASPRLPTAACGRACEGQRWCGFRHGAFENIRCQPSGLPDRWSRRCFAGRDDAMLLATLAMAPSPTGADDRRVIAPRTSCRPSFVISIAEMRDGEIWFGTRDAGLLRVQGSQVVPD